MPHGYGANKKVSLANLTLTLYNPNPNPNSNPNQVSLANPYTYDAHFALSTDRPDLLSFKQPTVLVPAGETRYIGLKFAPPPSVLGLVRVRV